MLLDKYKDAAESLLKFISIIIGLFFITGVLIQSFANDSIGIREESFIQIRSVFIGATFYIYVVLFYIVVVCLLYALFLIIFPVINKQYRQLLQLYKIIFLLVVLQALGNLVGYMVPWGYSWEDLYVKMFVWDVYLVSYYNFIFAFVYPKLIACLFIIIFYYIMKSKLLNISGNESKDEIFIRILWKSKTEPYRFYVVFPLLISIPFLLINYAIEVYPNIRTNIGGGQPNIVGIITNEPDSTNKLDKKVLWKLNETFTFITPLTDSVVKRTNVIAIKTESIKEIRYYKGYVKIKAGNQITMFKTE